MARTSCTDRFAHMPARSGRPSVPAYLRALLACLALTLACAFAQAPRMATAAEEQLATARPSTTGTLCVQGTQLCDLQGNPVVLKGVSTHGLIWYPQFVNESLFDQISHEWDANIVRLAMYTDDYVNENHDQSLEVLHQGIEAALAADMYVLVDWHILEDNDPNQRIDEAREFFDQISREYANVPNVLYEICNEPNGETTWSDVHAYADQIIPVIRANSPQAVVIVGTPYFDKELMSAARDPLAFDNVMYTCHFYVATHGKDLRGEVEGALAEGLPVFITECGLSQASGDGRVDFESAVAWFDFVREHKLSYVLWSLSNKSETSAFIKATSSAAKHLDESDLTPVGLWTKSLLQGEEPARIAVPAVNDAGMLVDGTSQWERELATLDLRPEHAWPLLALAAAALVALGVAARTLMRSGRGQGARTYDHLLERSGDTAPERPVHSNVLLCRLAILLSSFFSLVYLFWRCTFSVPTTAGWLAIAGNLILLVVECFGFVESVIHYWSMMDLRAHPLPQISDDAYPDVDIFIATYNEPVDLLRRTINGCTHLRYPDPSKVHVWVCDDNRRPEMRELAERMGVGYFDRPDNKGAKAGNLNHALSLTSAPYVVTLDADMIVRSDFLLKTIPYFVDAEQRNASLPEDERLPLGLLQTPQCFYDPDVFQHALYSETRATNEQDFFYRTVEVARTSTNSVIYGGSNTVLSRAALEAIGGFYTESITEDFATGLLIESAGFVSLATPEPLASGRTPHTFKEHIQQRTRWARGVIVTARKLGIMRRRNLSAAQKLSYWGSVVYWYSPLKNIVYVVSPLLFAVFGLPIFACSWLDLLVFWLPMFIAQELCLRIVSGNSVSAKWSGIHETSVMPHLLVPVLKESLGITLSAFKVTDKSGANGRRTVDLHDMMPFLVLIALSLVGMVRVVWLLSQTGAFGLAVLLFWLVRNTYYLIMAVFLVDGRDGDGEPVRVIDAEPVLVKIEDRDGTQRDYEGVATLLTEHSIRVYLDFAEGVGLGDRAQVHVDTDRYQADLAGSVVGLLESRSGATVHTIEILDYGTSELEYLQILYDRIPTLPQALTNDWGILEHLWRNIAFRVARTVH